MLDLSKYELTPMKTRFRQRDGAVVVFVGLATGAAPYYAKVSLLGDEKNYHYVTMSGKYNGNGEQHGRPTDSPKDVLSVAVKYEPKVGDEVYVRGPMFADRHVDGRPFRFGDTSSHGEWTNGMGPLIVKEIEGDAVIFHEQLSGYTYPYKWRVLRSQVSRKPIVS